MSPIEPCKAETPVFNEIGVLSTLGCPAIRMLGGKRGPGALTGGQRDPDAVTARQGWRRLATEPTDDIA